MPFDTMATLAVTEELKQLLEGSEVIKVYQTEDQRVFLALRKPGKRFFLEISLHPKRFYAISVEDHPPFPPTPPPFCMVLRKHLESACLQHIETLGLERVILFTFQREGKTRQMVAELMGRWSNLLLLGEEGIIIDCLKHIGASQNSLRQCLPGLPYTPPPSTGKPDPHTLSPEEITSLLKEVVPSGDYPEEPITAHLLVQLFDGLSPFSAQEVLARAKSREPADIAYSLKALWKSLEQKQYRPLVILDGQGKIKDFWVFPPAQIPREQQRLCSTLSEAIALWANANRVQEQEETLRKELRLLIHRSVKQLQRRIGQLEEDLKEAEKAESYRIMGEVLSTYLHQVPEGADQVELPNFYDPYQRPIKILLDPTLSPGENVEAYFQKYRKARRSYEALQPQIQETRERLNHLNHLLQEVEHSDSAKLEQIRSQIQQREITPVHSEKNQGREEGTSRPAPGVRRYFSQDGWEIWIGENKEANDLLVQKLASPEDWWLHVRVGTSAHAIIRTGRQPEKVPRSTLEEAARLVARQSDQKHSSIVPVDYTLKKYVRKPKGSPPGFVLYQREKTLYVSPKERT